MSIVTFWNNEKEQTGKTASIVAIATYMAIQHNYKVLLISTSLNDKTLERCYWEEKAKKKNFGLFGPNTSTVMANGMEGLSTIIKSNKIMPENITNYTKIVFKNTLEILPGFTGEKERYESDLIVANLSQRLSSINKFMETREKIPVLNSKKTLLLFNRYDKFSKYTVKNITRYMGEKNKVSTIPYNTLYFEACEESNVPDLFLRLRKTEEDDRNGFFLAEVNRAIENIIYRLQDLQMRM